MVGEPVTLACDYNSSPAPTSIGWQRVMNAQSSNINVLDSRYGGGTIVTPYLTIHTTRLSDAGIYTCSVTNQVGTKLSDPIFLFISGSEYGNWSECILWQLSIYKACVLLKIFNIQTHVIEIFNASLSFVTSHSINH